MKVVISYPKDYKGQCFCGNDATRAVWCAFAEPLPAIPSANIPEHAGIWTFICEDAACLKPNMTLKDGVR